MRPPLMFLTLCAVLTLGLWTATQYEVRHVPAGIRGAPWTTVLGYAIYQPHAMLGWWVKADQRTRQAMSGSNWILYGACLVAVVAGAMVMRLGVKKKDPGDGYGSAVWGNVADAKRAKLMTQRGVMLGSLEGWYLTDDADTHLLICGPTDSGKDTAHVIPTAHLDEARSMVIFDPKGGATFDMTVRYRSQCSDIVVFAPLDEGGVCLNVLETVHTFRDAQAIAIAHLAPGEMVRETATSLHFRELAVVLLEAGILHVLDTSQRRSMAGVLDFFTVTHETLEECLEEMISATHSDPELHTLIASMAREIQKVKDRELSGVWTTMMRGLHLYRDPRVARHTDTSDLDLDSMQYGPRPVTLYLVAPSPEELKHYHPLYRVVLDTLFRQLTLHPEERYKIDGRRVVVMANEFPAYGYMPRVADGAATLRGYGIKLCLIAQDLEQFWHTYGKETPLWGNLHIKVFHTPENDLTAKRLSENMLDTMTIEREVVSYQGWMQRRGTTSTQQHARQLMTTGEVMKMDPDDLLLFVGGYPPFKAKKVRWHHDPVFKARVRPLQERRP